MEAMWWLALACFLVCTLGKGFDEQQLGKLHLETLKENEKLQLEQVTGQGVSEDVRDLIPKTWQKLLSDLTTPKDEAFDVSRAMSAEGFTKEQTTRVRIEAWYCLSKEASCMSKPADKTAIKKQLEDLWNSVKETTDAWNRITVYAKREHVAFLVQVSDNITQAGKKASSSSDIELIEFPVSLLNPNDPFVYPQNVTEKISSFLFDVLQNAKSSFGKKDVNHGPTFVHAEETFVSTYRIRITLHTFSIPSVPSFNKTLVEIQNHIQNEQFRSPPYLIIKKELMRVHIEICELVQPPPSQSQQQKH